MGSRSTASNGVHAAHRGGPGLRVGFSGSLWNDLSYAKLTADKSWGAPSRQEPLDDADPGVLRVTPPTNAKGGWFAQGNAEFVAQGDMRPTCSAACWERPTICGPFGKCNLFDSRSGALGWKLPPLRQGLTRTRSSAPAGVPPERQIRSTDGYGLSYFWDRQNSLLGGYAVHVYPTKYLRGEILGHFGAGNATTSPYQIDVRPSAIFDIGWVKLKAGLEYGKATPQDPKTQNRDTRSGYGFAAQFVVNPWVEFGGSFARGFQDQIDNKNLPMLEASNTFRPSVVS